LRPQMLVCPRSLRCVILLPRTLRLLGSCTSHVHCATWRRQLLLRSLELGQEPVAWLRWALPTLVLALTLVVAWLPWVPLLRAAPLVVV